MSSRAWTEVATGAEARSLRRWVWRVAMAVVARNMVLLGGVIVAAILFAALMREAILPGSGDCFDRCDDHLYDGRPNDLIDLID